MSRLNKVSLKLRISYILYYKTKTKIAHIQGLSVRRNISPRNMIKTQKKKTEKFMINFLLNRF
jgi:hypothetical protein